MKGTSLATTGLCCRDEDEDSNGEDDGDWFFGCANHTIFSPVAGRSNGTPGLVSGAASSPSSLQSSSLSSSLPLSLSSSWLGIGTMRDGSSGGPSRIKRRFAPSSRSMRPSDNVSEDVTGAVVLMLETLGGAAKRLPPEMARRTGPVVAAVGGAKGGAGSRTGN